VGAESWSDCEHPARSGKKGRRYSLANADEIAGQVTQLEPGFCHVGLSADVARVAAAAFRGAR